MFILIIKIIMKSKWQKKDDGVNPITTTGVCRLGWQDNNIVVGWLQAILFVFSWKLLLFQFLELDIYVGNRIAMLRYQILEGEED